MALPLSLDTYAFRIRAANKPSTSYEVRPPALFRWKDRGGLDEVTDTLIERLGGPINYTNEYASRRLAGKN